MTGLIPKKFLDRVQNIPTHLQYSTSHKSLKYGELLSAIDLMDKEKAIVYDKGEYHREYGVNGVAGLRAVAKKVKVPYLLRVVEDRDKIVIFKNDLPKKVAV